MNDYDPQAETVRGPQADETMLAYSNPEATALAYSVDTPPTYAPVFDYPTPNFHWATVRAAATFVAVMIGAGVVIFAAFYQRREPPKPQIPVTPPTITVTAAAPTPPAHVPAQTPDELYKYLYTQATNLTLNKPGEAPAAISLGHAQCDYLSLGHSPSEATTQLTNEYVISRQDAYGVVEAAVRAYCPEYTPQLR